MIKRPSAVPALERSLDILDWLSTRRNGATAAELVKRLKIPIASVYRITALLERRGHIEQDDHGSYHLSQKQIILGFAAHTVSPLVCVAQPILRALAAQTHEMSELAIRAGPWELMMLDTWQTEGTPLRIRSRPGLTFELAPTTPHGHCFLAFGPPRTIDRFVSAPEHRPFLNQRRFGDLEGDIELWRKMGFAWHRKTGPGDVARVAAPVFDPRNAVPTLLATIGIALDAARLSTLRANQWGQRVKSAARELEARMK
jgi:DNA-binding IclR family transcriptional regulator